MHGKRATSSSVTLGPAPTIVTSLWSGQMSKPGGWNEGKAQKALNNCYRGRQKAKTLEYWPFTLKSFVPWFRHDILVKMLPTMRQHGITWIRKTRAGKSLGSKTVLFAQSRFEIEAAARSDLVPSIVTAKHLDFFKAEPISKFQPGVFDDGLLLPESVPEPQGPLSALMSWSASFLSICKSRSLLGYHFLCLPHCCIHILCLPLCFALQEEDATVWARYSSIRVLEGTPATIHTVPSRKPKSWRMHPSRQDELHLLQGLFGPHLVVWKMPRI